MKLRLLVTDHCNRDCPLCVNKQYDLNQLPVEYDYSQYDTIILTGGEPMLFPNYIVDVIHLIRSQCRTDAKILLHTAKVDDVYSVLCILDEIDGLTVTIHEESDIKAFIELDKCLDYATPRFDRKSLKLCIFDGILLNSWVKDWDVHKIKWLKDCLLPEGEVFKRYSYDDQTYMGARPHDRI